MRRDGIAIAHHHGAPSLGRGLAATTHKVTPFGLQCSRWLLAVWADFQLVRMTNVSKTSAEGWYDWRGSVGGSFLQATKNTQQ